MANAVPQSPQTRAVALTLRTEDCGRLSLARELARHRAALSLWRLTRCTRSAASLGDDALDRGVQVCGCDRLDEMFIEARIQCPLKILSPPVARERHQYEALASRQAAQAPSECVAVGAR
jgi:hypothetical protein